MTSQALAGLLLRQPFQPFRFVLGDNTEVVVLRADQVKHKPGDRIVVVSYSSGGESIIDLDHVALIEVGALMDIASDPLDSAAVRPRPLLIALAVALCLRLVRSAPEDDQGDPRLGERTRIVIWLGWCLVTLGLVVWAVGARGFADELAEFLRGDKRSGPPDR